MEIKFISWSGKYPNLCSGTLKFRIRGKLYTLSGCFLLESGGTAGCQLPATKVAGLWAT